MGEKEKKKKGTPRRLLFSSFSPPAPPARSLSRNHSFAKGTYVREINVGMNGVCLVCVCATLVLGGVAYWLRCLRLISFYFFLFGLLDGLWGGVGCDDVLLDDLPLFSL